MAKIDAAMLRKPHGRLPLSVATPMAVRTFYGLVIDANAVHNGAWLAIIIGAAIALVALWRIRSIAARGISDRAIRGLSLLFFGLVAFDCAWSISCAAVSAGYVSFFHISTWLLSLPLLAAATRAGFLGYRAVENTSALTSRTIDALLLIVVILQWPFYRPEWVAPVFGYGQRQLLLSAVRVGAWMVIIAGPQVMGAAVSDPDRCASPFHIVMTASLCAILPIMMYLMMTPSAIVPNPRRALRFDALLTNGRAPLYYQLPAVTAWFLGMLNLICYEASTARALLKQCLPSIRTTTAVILTVVTIALLSIAHLPDRLTIESRGEMIWYLCALMGILFSTVLISGRRRQT